MCPGLRASHRVCWIFLTNLKEMYDLIVKSYRPRDGIRTGGKDEREEEDGLRTCSGNRYLFGS
jgi:hypothetical protein